jgi:hypothetical protein
MSINMLANAATARRPDMSPINSVPTSMSEIAAAAATPPEIASKQTPGQTVSADGITTMLNVLFGYIPIEVVTVYTAVSTALQPDKTQPSANAANPNPLWTAFPNTLWIAFWCFFVATPLTVWVIYATKVKATGKPLPVKYGEWPLWEMIAALIAFSAWAFALPNSPFGYKFPWYSQALAAIAVVVASTILGLLAPLFQRPLS